MHELAITQSVLAAITDRLGDAPVVRVRLSIGRLSGVLPDAVRFSFDLVTADTSLAGAALEIEEPPGRARCRSCDARFETVDPIPVCRCGGVNIELVGGQDLRILAVEVSGHV